MMKRTLTFIACVAVCCAMAVSCKNAKTAEPTPEEIQAQKVALADSVLADIDRFVKEYNIATETAFRIQCIELTDVEKRVKPDYILDPSIANTLVTKSQKVNALAIYLMDICVMKIYDMPTETTKEVAIKLATELNHPVDIDIYKAEIPRTERIKLEYEKCKENGDLAYFWQLQNAYFVETNYIIAQNPELFFSKISEEQWQSFCIRKKTILKAIEELSKYDGEMAELWELRNKYRITASDDERDQIGLSIAAAKQFFIANKDKYAAKRNALLQ